jgi:hypothetical protein
MKSFFIFLFIVFFYAQATYSQELRIDSTRFISGNNCCTQVNYAIPTTDKGVLLVGLDAGNPGGIIPYFPMDISDNGNVFIVKIDSNQQISWIKVYGGSSTDAAASACQTLDGGYAILAGTASNDGNVTGYKGGEGDFWLLRLDGSGNLLWEKTFGSSAQDAPTSIANTPDHGFILSGITNGSDGDVPFHYGDFYSFDWLVIKTDSLGNKQWSKDLGGTGDEDQQGSILSVDSSYYLISSTDSKDHDCTDTAWHAGVNTYTDYYILKLNDTGKVVWDSSYGGSGPDGPYSAMFDARDSTIVMNGVTYSGDYMVTGYKGNEDMWVIKVNKNGTLIWQKTLGSPNQETGTGICEAPNGGYMAYGWTHNSRIGEEGMWFFVLDNSSNEITNKIFGGSSNNMSSSVVPYLSGYAATGNSTSHTFTEGSTYGYFDGTPFSPFISYIDSSPLSVNNVHSINKNVIGIYPNPTHNNITIIIPENQSGILMIINEIGQVIYKEQTHWQTGSINIGVTEWCSGVYFVEWNNADGIVLTTKFVKM